MSITILFLQTPQSVDKSSLFERKIPSLSLNLSRILDSAAPQTNTTWWKLSVSAFQRYWGWGVSDRVYIGKSTISHVDTNGCRNLGILPIETCVSRLLLDGMLIPHGRNRPNRSRRVCRADWMLYVRENRRNELVERGHCRPLSSEILPWWKHDMRMAVLSQKSPD